MIRWFDPATQTGHLLVLSNGELLTDITGDYWAAGATGYDQGSGFWLENPTGILLINSANDELLINDTDSLWSAHGLTRLFIGNSSGDKMTWDGSNLSIVGSFTVVGGNAAKIDLSNVTGNYAGSNAIGGSASNTLAIGTLPTSTVEGWAHASDTTKIDGGDIYTGSVTAAKITVTNLAAINADLGAVTAGSIVVGTANKLWLNEGADGVLAIGGSTKASAPFRVTPAGVLTATGATISGSVAATSGSIGGWTIDTAALYKDTGTAATSAGMSPVDYPFYAGATYANRASATWRVTPAGKMYIEGTVYLSAVGGYTLTIGNNWTAEPTGDMGIYIGYKTGNGSSAEGSTGVGREALIENTGIGANAIGERAGYQNTGVGLNALGENAGNGNSGGNVLALGNGAAAGNSGARLIAIGLQPGQYNTFDDCVLVGYNTVATAANQIVFGGSTYEYTDLFGGGGVSQATPPAWTINATGGLGTNITGGALKLAGGRGTGTGAGGAVVIQTAAAGSTGSSQNSLVDRVTVNTDGSMDITQWMQMPEISDPAAPASNYARLYAKDNGAGKTQLCVRFPTGAVQVIATEP